jgi:hypothetical protein
MPGRRAAGVQLSEWRLAPTGGILDRGVPGSLVGGDVVELEGPMGQVHRSSSNAGV